MKKFPHFLTSTLVLSSLLLFSCKKQISETLADEATVASMTLPPTNCKPEVFGVYETSSYGNNWTTIAQKWYSGDKVHYFKGNFSGASPGHAGMQGIEPMFNLPWGEVKYEGNQVYLHDVAKNRLVYRATLDGSGKILASYMNNQRDDDQNAYMMDTTYYYYSGDRLDYILSFSKILLYQPNSVYLFRKYTFEYDMYGNVSSIYYYPANYKINFVYDYSMPVSGIMANYIVTTSFRLAEFLELMKVPMHHALKEYNFGSYNGTTFNMLYQDKFENYVLDNGRVHSYDRNSISYKWRYYNGWNCGSMNNEPTNRLRNGIKSLEEFEKLYPAPKK